MDVTVQHAGAKSKPASHPFRSAVLRGMGLVAPPLLTIVIFLWVGSTIQDYVLEPVTGWSQDTLVWALKDVRTDVGAKPGQETVVLEGGESYCRLDNDTYIPWHVYERVSKNPGAEPLAQTGTAYYRRYVELKFMQPLYTIPFFLSVFVLVLYLLGKFMAAGIGRMFYNLFEQGVHRLPLIRNVYSSVKQVSDFFFSERQIEITRVVAVEYPRKGVWSLGFVTGVSMRDIRAAVNEPILSVLMATSPMPMTGFTITVRKSETIDLNITVEQAFQFIISCGVVVPVSQVQEGQDEVPPKVARGLLESGGAASTTDPSQVAKS